MEVDISQEQEEMQVINPPMLQQPQHQVLLTPQQAAPRTPEIQRQVLVSNLFFLNFFSRSLCKLHPNMLKC